LTYLVIFVSVVLFVMAVLKSHEVNSCTQLSHREDHLGLPEDWWFEKKCSEPLTPVTTSIVFGSHRDGHQDSWPKNIARAVVTGRGSGA